MENYCPHCGEPLKENADFCLSCGKLTQEQPRQSRTTYQTMSKTMIAIIGFFAINFVMDLFTSTFYNMGMSLTLYVPGIITIILAILIAVIAFIENNNRQLSKETFIIALVIAGFFIFRTAASLISYYSFWVRIR